MSIMGSIEGVCRIDGLPIYSKSPRVSMLAQEELVSSTIAAAPATAPMAQTEHRERLFYLIAGLVVIAGVAIGFRMFYMHGLNDAGQSVTQQIAPLVYLHGVLMNKGYRTRLWNQ